MNEFDDLVSKPALAAKDPAITETFWPIADDDEKDHATSGRKLYAVADVVPAEIGYLTAGKLYPVLGTEENLFEVIDDGGEECSFLWNGCNHLDGGNWRKVWLTDDGDKEMVDSINSGPDETSDFSGHIDATLAEKGKRYGEFHEHARITQSLKRAMADTPNWSSLSDDKKEALEMIAHKIGRILNGDPDYIDSWHDISGYATLVEKDLDKAMAIVKESLTALDEVAK
jgi:hypothetical protein